MKRGDGNILVGIFINYGEFHENYQHSLDYKFRRTVDLCQWERWSHTFMLEQSRVLKRTWKWFTVFLGAKRVSHSTEGPGVGTTLGKFNSSDSNERFWQMFANLKIGKTKIWRLEELEILLRVAEEIVLNVYKS